jgi:hypothetical protein
MSEGMHSKRLFRTTGSPSSDNDGGLKMVPSASSSTDLCTRLDSHIIRHGTTQMELVEFMRVADCKSEAKAD